MHPCCLLLAPYFFVGCRARAGTDANEPQEGTLRSRNVAPEFRPAGEICVRTSWVRQLPHHGREWKTRLYGARETSRQGFYRLYLSFDVHEHDCSGGTGQQDSRGKTEGLQVFRVRLYDLPPNHARETG